MNLWRSVQYLVVLTVVSFAWGCATPPSTAPVTVEAKPSIEVVKKKKQKAKVKKKKRQKKEGKQEVSLPEPFVEAAEGSVPGIDPPETAEPEDAVPVAGQMMFHYDYYPDPRVYFDTIRHLYFYNEGGRWTMSVALPTTFQRHLGESVRLKLTTDQPYTLHSEHLLKYPPVERRRLFD